MFTKETNKFWSLVKTGLADVDGFGICIQVYVWPGSDHRLSTLPPKGITSLAKSVLDFQEKTKYIHEKRLPPVVKEMNNTYRTTGTALPTEQTCTKTQTGRHTHTRPRITHSTLLESSGAALMKTIDYNSIHCGPIIWLIVVHEDSPVNAVNDRIPPPRLSPPPPPPSVDHYLHIPRGSHYRHIFHAQFGSLWRKTTCYS